MFYIRLKEQNEISGGRSDALCGGNLVKLNILVSTTNNCYRMAVIKT